MACCTAACNSCRLPCLLEVYTQGLPLRMLVTIAFHLDAEECALEAELQAVPNWRTPPAGQIACSFRRGC